MPEETCNVPEFAIVPPDNVVILEEPLPVRFSEPPLTVPPVKMPPTVTEPPETFAIREPVAVTVPAEMLPLEIEPVEVAPVKLVVPSPERLARETSPLATVKLRLPAFATAPREVALETNPRAPEARVNAVDEPKLAALNEPALSVMDETLENAPETPVNVPAATVIEPLNVLATFKLSTSVPTFDKAPAPLNTPVSVPAEMESAPLSAIDPPVTVPRVRVARLPTVRAPAVIVVSVPPPFAMRLPPLSSASLVNPATVTVPPLITVEVKVPPTVTEPPETFELKLLATLTVPPVMLPLEIEPLLANVVTPVPDKPPKTIVPDVPLNVSEPNSATAPSVSAVPENLAVVPALPVNSAPLFASTALSEPPLRTMVPVFAREPVPALNVPAVM